MGVDTERQAMPASDSASAAAAVSTSVAPRAATAAASEIERVQPVLGRRGLYVFLALLSAFPRFRPTSTCPRCRA